MTTPFRSALAGVLLAAAVPTAAHAQTTFASFAAFSAGVGALGVDSFDELTPFESVAGPLARQAGSFGYSVAATPFPLDNLFTLENPDVAGDVWLSSEEASATIEFSGFGASVRAIGGSFFATNFDGAVSGTSITVLATDVLGVTSALTFAPTSADAFWGVLFENELLSLTLIADNSEFTGEAFFPTVNDLVLAESASAVPEPSTAALMLVGGALLMLVRRRRLTR